MVGDDQGVNSIESFCYDPILEQGSDQREGGRLVQITELSCSHLSNPGLFPLPSPSFLHYAPATRSCRLLTY